MTNANHNRDDGLSRRDFIKTTSMASLAAAMSATGALFAGGAQEKIRAGVIGCGGRGTGAAIDCVTASPDVVIAALGDLFPDQLPSTMARLKEKLTADR